MDRNRPGVVERTLDCIEAHTPPVYDQDASEEETCEARLAALELKKATENRRHRERRRINKLQCKNDSTALGTITEAIHVLGQILPKLRILPKASPDALSMRLLDTLNELLSTARWVIKLRQGEPDCAPQRLSTRDTGDAAHTLRPRFVAAPKHVLFVAPALDTISGATHAVVQILQKLQTLPNMSTDELSMRLLDALDAIVEDACIWTKRRQEEAAECATANNSTNGTLTAHYDL